MLRISSRFGGLAAIGVATLLWSAAPAAAQTQSAAGNMGGGASVSTCGFGARSHHWQCPSCKEWGTVKPLLNYAVV